jgi:hypothetical protein
VTENIDFRDERVQAEWESGRLNPLLRTVFTEAAEFYSSLGRTPCITCIWRSAEEEEQLLVQTGQHPSGVHRVWRGIDMHADSWIDPYAVKTAEYINSRWTYDPLRRSYKVALFEPHGTGPHLHFQVSEFTVQNFGPETEPRQFGTT